MFTANSSTRSLLVAATAIVCLATVADSGVAQVRKSGRAQVATRGGFTVNRSARSSDKVVKVHIGRWQEYWPILTRGDREFGGHGPKVQVFVQFFIQQNTIYRRISMVAQETSGGTSRAAGWSVNHFVYRPKPGKTVKMIKSFSIPGHTNSKPVVDETMHGHNPIRRQTSLGRVTVYGDRNGADIEKYTRVHIDFDFDLTVVLSDRPLHNDEARLPGRVFLKPPHVAGDKDFKGHGPHVQVGAVVHHDGRGAYLTISMGAQETFGGTTKAAGSTKVMFYTAPLLHRIVAIRGKKLYPKLIDYYDNDHEDDRFDTELGPAIVKGDRRGDDAGVYTSVELPDIQRRVIIELERVEP